MFEKLSSRGNNGNDFYRCHGSGVFVKHFRGENASSQIPYARECTEKWLEHGFKVPCILAIDAAPIDRDWLAFEDLGEVTLAVHLRNTKGDLDALESCLQQLFEGLAHRHSVALGQSDRRLIHPDLHTENVLVYDEQYYIIDFEDLERKSGVLEPAYREIHRLAKEILQILGREYLDLLATIIVAAYSELCWVIDAWIQKDYKNPHLQLLKDVARLRRVTRLRRQDFARALKQAQLCA